MKASYRPYLQNTTTRVPFTCLYIAEAWTLPCEQFMVHPCICVYGLLPRFTVLNFKMNPVNFFVFHNEMKCSQRCRVRERQTILLCLAFDCGTWFQNDYNTSIWKKGRGRGNHHSLFFLPSLIERHPHFFFFYSALEGCCDLSILHKFQLNTTTLRIAVLAEKMGSCGRRQKDGKTDHIKTWCYIIRRTVSVFLILEHRTLKITIFRR